jgi:acyl-coenzyme A synthetase/AMP-(fatty) acid ligase
MSLSTVLVCRIHPCIHNLAPAVVFALVQWIIRHTLFGGLLSGATVVMATKHPAVIQAAQLVVALQRGRVVFSGSPAAYADWKAQQGPHAAGAAGNGWAPLVR